MNTDTLLQIAEELIRMDRHAMHNGESVDFETLDQIIRLAKRALGETAVSRINREVDAAS